jgi:hypothetical protein
MRTLARHTRPGGVLIVDPWLTPDAWLTPDGSKDGRVSLLVQESEGLAIARVGVSRRRGRISTTQYGYAVGRTRGPVRLFRERHELGLFIVAEQLAAMESAGFRARFYRGGFTKQRGLFVAIRRAEAG